LSGSKEKFSKILVAIDGSRSSMDAVDYAITIAQRDDVELNALYVVSSPTRDDYTSDMPEDQIPETVKDIVHFTKKESQPWFNEISDKVRTTAKLESLKDNDTKKN
jgi:nucleotide-binding universal stress UspA family protein